MLPPFHVTADRASVQAWSSFRLPFEPKGDAMDLRTDLRRRLGELVPEPDAIFGCTYRSDAESFVDTENVLLYNVGPSTFTRHARRGLRFERVFAPPPPSPVPLVAPAAHYVAYRPTQDDTFGHWQRGMPIARWFDVPWPSRSSKPAPANIWWALRMTRPEVVGRLDARTARFAVRIDIEDPNDELDPAAAMKPLLDAVISAFHVHDRPLVLRAAAERIVASGIGGDVGAVERLLTDGHYNALGTRNLVSPSRSERTGPTHGVKWNPEDERCVAAQLVRRLGGSGPTRFCGELFAVSPT